MLYFSIVTKKHFLKNSSFSNFNIFFLFFAIATLSIFSFEFLRGFFGDYNYPPLNPSFRYIILSVISLLYLLYFKSALDFKNKKQSLYILPLTVLVFCTLIPPLFSIDLYEYIIRGRMSAIYGLNPFFNTPETISHDPLYPMIFWKTVTTAYGPLWSLLSSFLVTITGRSVLLNIFGFKSTLLIFHLGTGLVLYRLALAIHTEKSKYIAFLYLFNPYILFMNLVENHNDIIMVFFLILAFYLLVKDKFLLSTVALSLSIATKYIPILLVPLFFIYIYRKIPGIKNKVLLTIKSLSLNAGVFYLLWKPFNLKRVIN